MPGFSRFCRTFARRGLRLAPQSLLLFSGDRFYLNGEPTVFDGPLDWLRRLADDRVLMDAGLSTETLGWLHEQYALGVVMWN